MRSSLVQPRIQTLNAHPRTTTARKAPGLGPRSCGQSPTRSYSTMKRERQRKLGSPVGSSLGFLLNSCDSEKCHPGPWVIQTQQEKAWVTVWEQGSLGPTRPREHVARTWDCGRGECHGCTHAASPNCKRVTFEYGLMGSGSVFKIRTFHIKIHMLSFS